MEKLKAYYFTGTGNTRYVTEKLCGYLQDRYDTETFDVTKTASVSSADLLLFAFPVYGSSPPKPMVRFVLNNAHKIRGRHFNRVACYETVYIVSNIPLSEQYTNIQQTEPKTWAAFLRRITAVYNFDISKETPVSKHTGKLQEKPLTLIPIVDDGESPF